jgi:hypothetical protein
MVKKRSKDKKTLEINGFPLYLEISDSEIVIEDENNNSVRVTKKSRQSIVLNLSGIFSSKE